MWPVAAELDSGGIVLACLLESRACCSKWGKPGKIHRTSSEAYFFLDIYTLYESTLTAILQIILRIKTTKHK